jgi:Fe2+ transport system protein FeoA
MYKWKQIMVNKPLANLAEGEKGEITKIRGSAVVQRHLLEMGFAVGREISIENVERAPQDFAVTIKAGDNTCKLDERLASNIRVKVPITMEDRKISALDTAYAKLFTHYL